MQVSIEGSGSYTSTKNILNVKVDTTQAMADAIAKEYNIKLIEVLTGFKFIGEQIKLFEQTGSNEY